MPVKRDPTNELHLNILNMIEYGVAVACGLNAITQDEGRRLNSQMAEWRARLPLPRSEGRRTKPRRRTTAHTNPRRTAPTAPTAAERPRDNSA